jgi:CBS domain-containing protein
LRNSDEEVTMKINDIMTSNPSWCVAQDSAVQAARIMQEKNVGIVPVVESPSHHRLLGVVTDRDLCLGVVAMDRQPNTIRVEQCMSSRIVACRPEDNVQRAADLMCENQVRRIPVVDHDGVLQGMVSTADIWQRSNLSSTTTHNTLKKVTEPTAHASKPRAKPNQAA